MLMLEDVAELWALRDERYAVQVVKHDHVPREAEKFLGAAADAVPEEELVERDAVQQRALQGAHARVREPRPGLELHQFKWLGERIADRRAAARVEPPRRLLRLRRRDVALVHFTLGGPYFAEYRGCEYADEWRAERDAMLHAEHRAGSPTAA